MEERTRKVCELVCQAGLVAGSALGAWLVFAVMTGSEAPDREHVVPFVNHGRTIFLTTSESELQVVVPAAVCISMGGLFLLKWLGKKK
jgi:hypothetical protein